MKLDGETLSVDESHSTTSPLKPDVEYGVSSWELLELGIIYFARWNLCFRHHEYINTIVNYVVSNIIPFVEN